MKIVRGTVTQVRRCLLLQAIGNACSAAVLLAIAAIVVWASFRSAPKFL